MIETICPNCGNKRAFGEAFAGRTFRCPICKQPVTIPNLPEIKSQEFVTNNDGGIKPSIPVSNTGINSPATPKKPFTNDTQVQETPADNSLRKDMWVIVPAAVLGLIVIVIMIVVYFKKDKPKSVLGGEQFQYENSQYSSQAANYPARIDGSDGNILLEPISFEGPCNPNNTITDENYCVAKMFDNNLSTAWVYRQDTRLSDIKLTITLPGSDYFIDHINLYNGYQATEDSFYNSGRPSYMSIVFKGQFSVSGPLEDTRTGQRLGLGYDVHSPYPNTIIDLVFKQNDLYPGTMYQNFAISEIQIVGHRLNSSQETSYSNEDEEDYCEGDDYLYLFSNPGYWSSKKVDENDLTYYTKDMLEIIRNSIFARHGYKFKRKDLLDYFSQFEWYKPYQDDMTIVSKSLSSIEQYNVEFIKNQEMKMKQ